MLGFASSVIRSKCLTKTVPAGKVHSPVGAKEICSSEVYGAPELGTANHRVFTAPSDQSGTLTLYGISAETGVNVLTSPNTPVRDSRCGKESLILVGMLKNAGAAARVVRPYGKPLPETTVMLTGAEVPEYP